MNRSNRHRAEVIELYENGLKAAVKFSSGRIECVVKRDIGSEFKIGMRGMVNYVPSVQGFEWVFAPFKAKLETTNE